MKDVTFVGQRHPCNVKAFHGFPRTQQKLVSLSCYFVYWPLYKVLEASISLYLYEVTELTINMVGNFTFVQQMV